MCVYHRKGKLSVRDSQDQVLNTKGIYLPQGNRGQRVRDKDSRQRMKKNEKGTSKGRECYPEGLCLGREETDVTEKNGSL